MSFPELFPLPDPLVLDPSIPDSVGIFLRAANSQQFQATSLLRQAFDNTRHGFRASNPFLLAMLESRARAFLKNFLPSEGERGDLLQAWTLGGKIGAVALKRHFGDLRVPRLESTTFTLYDDPLPETEQFSVHGGAAYKANQVVMEGLIAQLLKGVIYGEKEVLNIKGIINNAAGYVIHLGSIAADHDRRHPPDFVPAHPSVDEALRNLLRDEP